ncbi:MAG TPA: hypothetical protein ENK54_02890 [Thiotrichales bacterium]|nr:hypothetical protein [Thiotrichales bacterium]
MDLRPYSLLLAAALLLGGCVTPPPPLERPPSPLAEIASAFRETVEAIREEPDLHWHNGWMGNLWINTVGGANRGLCYQWQRRVYLGVLPTVRRVGWRAVGIVINRGTLHEHHAVVVFDERRIPLDTVLARPDQAIWVLDAWRRGEPDIWPLELWLEIPLRVSVPPSLEDLAAVTGE